MITKIIAGGQTGADRGGLDAALHCGLPHGGWCPKGRKALDGQLDLRYQLNETPTANYLQRTEWNVRDSDATVIFTLGEDLTGGSKKTAGFATKHGKPWIHIPIECMNAPAGPLRKIIEENTVKRINVAGSRESKEPGIYEAVMLVLGCTMGE